MIEITPLASGSAGNCYHVTDGRTPLLLECGIPFREIQKGLNFRVLEIVGCLVSHEHQDHCKAIKEILKAGIDVYTSYGTLEALGLTNHHRAHYFGDTFNLGSWYIKAFDVRHDAVEPVGFLLHSMETGERLVYLTDTMYSKYRFVGLTHIMVECNYALDILRTNIEAGTVPIALKNRLLRSHFSLDHVKDFLLANDLSKVREIWLLHLSDGNSDAMRFKREIQELTGKMVFVAGQ